MAEVKKKAAGYDKYVDWKLFIIPVVLLFAILVLPTPYGMKDVGTEVKVGPKAVVNFITKELFDKKVLMQRNGSFLPPRSWNKTWEWEPFQ